MENLLNSVIDEISSKFEILETFDSVDYDHDIDLLDSKIKSFSNFVFDSNQRILIFYQDTGYYQDLTYGSSVFLNNLYTILKKYSIPSEFIIVFSNHCGISKELEHLNLKTGYTINKVVETFLWYDFPEIEKIHELKNYNANCKKDFLFTCLNNIQRIHRNYTLCQLKEHNLLGQGIVSYRFKNELD